MDNIRFLLLMALLRRRQRRARARQRSMYLRNLFISRSSSSLIAMLREDDVYHHKMFRMNVSNFDYIASLISKDVTHSPNHQLPISPMTRLAITLRYLASGNSMISIGVTFRVSPASVRMILRETLTSIIRHLKPIYFPPPTPTMWATQEEIFCEKWNFPNACGAIDGKHVRLRCPRNSGSVNHNYKSFFSIVLLAIAGGDYSVVAADIGGNGASSDSGILMRSAMGRALFENKLGLPGERKLPGSLVITPHVILGDEGFGLKSYLMRPFPGNSLETPKSVFNYRLSRARRVVENMFGILSARWRIYNVPIHCDMDLVHLIVEGTLILHNFLLKRSDHGVFTGDFINENGEIVDGGWRSELANNSGILPIPIISNGNHSHDAAQVRNDFKNYFNSGVGSTTWQYHHVTRGFHD